MIILMTGVPGASKTINTIKFINEDDQFKGRPVYYHNIKELKKSNEKGVEVLTGDWNQLDDDQALEWYKLPKGSVVVFDECQDLFPVTTSRKGAPPECLSMFAKHRHYGIDIFLITQESRNIDSFVRRLVGLHRHHARHFGTKKLKIYEWQNRCSENVNDWHEKQEANIHQSTIDSKYFGVYHSAEVHTHKSRLPYTKLALVIIPIFLLPFLFYFIYTQIADKAEVTQETNSDGPQAAQSENYDSSDLYISQLKPRIEGLAFTAPIYDEIRQPEQYPWPSCVIREKTQECTCYSQQATLMKVPNDICTNIVRHGLFDHAKKPNKYSKSSRQADAGERQQKPASRSRPRVTYLKEGDWLLNRSTVSEPPLPKLSGADLVNSGIRSF